MCHPCNLCPRRCNTLRPNGFCRMPEEAVIARAAPHFGEEPCISGKNGSGTVFFVGCNLRCVFCQNSAISRGKGGHAVSAEELRKIFFDLIDQRVHNINLVTPTHYADVCARALEGGLSIPVAYNCGGYELPETLRMLEGKINIYMPDLKYADDALAARLSGAPDYFARATAAIQEMVRQTGRFLLNKKGLMQKGVLIRHLVLPGQLENTRRVLDWIAASFPRRTVMVSLMGQYTPLGEVAACAPDLNRTLSAEEYAEAAAYLEQLGLEYGYLQPPEAAGTGMIPDFEQ